MAGTPTASVPLQMVMAIIAGIFLLRYTDNLGPVSQKTTELLYGKKGCLPIDSLGNITLHYFAARGRLEPIRMLLKDAAVDFEETKFTKENWSKNKKLGIDSGLYTFGQVPAIETSTGVKLSQSGAILRLLSRFTGGDCDCSSYTVCDSVAATIDDCRAQLSKVLYNFTQENRQQYFEEVASVSLGHLERIAPKVSKDEVFMIDNRVTFIDYLTFNLLENHMEFANYDTNKKVVVLAKFPKLSNFFTSFGSRSNLKTYIKSSERYPFNLPVINKKN